MFFPISVCIPVKNEEANLSRCLTALGGMFDEIVVVDSGSTDKTREIALAAGALILDFEWDGHFPKKRNWVLRNFVFRNSWVLFLDADEQVTPKFLDEIMQALPESPHDGYWLTYTNWFMGRPLQHGDLLRKLALFRVGSGEYEAFPEAWWSHLDMEVHEHPILEGSTGIIKARLEHHDYRGLKHYLTKHNEYSTWESCRYVWLHESGLQAWGKLTKRQRFKYRHLQAWWLGWVYFLVAYIWKKGFMDGWEGLVFSSLKRRYFSEIRLKIRETI